ncbi:MAG: 4-alpha-glucanotransferase [Deltaproteobacteria bacterium]|nr:4-alpha-glucanotransferase [Deltaproteobacteria bacterium]
MRERGSGILLHLTSLPSPFGIGDLGPWAYRFADFLAETRQRFWQILPLNPTDPVHFNSPYHTPSAFALNPLLISPEILSRDGWLPGDIASSILFPPEEIDYERVIPLKEDLLDRAFGRFKESGAREEYEAFCLEEAEWLEDYTLFSCLKVHFQGKPWNEWPAELRDREPGALERAKKEFAVGIEKEKFLQYLLFRQWRELKAYCNGKGIQFIGDFPIYMVHDSVDVWCRPELFELDEEKRPRAVSGVPPDYFSETGQLWGNPVYRWEVMKEEGYAWWIRRVAHNLKLFDWVRVDHFRGFVAYWEVPAGEDHAINGRWVEAPALDFFSRLKRVFPSLPFIAEDLGVITPNVTEIMEHFGFPGMKILLFAFGDPEGKNPYLPHNHVKNGIVYTGTHDNNTSRGWFEKDATEVERANLVRYLGREVTPDTVHRELTRLAMMSVARWAVIPLQDWLGLGEEARMNRPATSDHQNWKWRLLPEQLTPSLAEEILEMTQIYGRA